jgi:hypothetical protein
MNFFSRSSTLVSKLTLKEAGILLFLIALAVRFCFIVVTHPYTNLTRFELERTAISLATTGVYGNPYAIPTGPTAHVSPGYTLILAGLFRMLGSGTSAEIVKEVLACGIASLEYSLLPWVASSIGMNRIFGILAGFIAALLPLKTSTEIDGDWEAPYTALFLMFICVIVVRLWRQQRLETKTSILHGFVWGLAILFVSALLPMLLVFVALGFYFCRKAGLIRYGAFAGLQLLIVALLLAPWIIRNHRALGAWIATRSNLGLEMRISNNDLATPSERRNDLNGLYTKYHPLQNPQEALKVRELGEVAYNRQALAESTGWIRAHPRRFLELTFERIGWFWFFRDSTSKIKTALLAITALLGFCGLFFVWRQEPITASVLTVVLALYPLPNYLVHLGLRQRYPIDWLLTLLSVVAVTTWTKSRLASRSLPDQATAL